MLLPAGTVAVYWYNSDKRHLITLRIRLSFSLYKFSFLVYIFPFIAYLFVAGNPSITTLILHKNRTILRLSVLFDLKSVAKVSLYYYWFSNRRKMLIFNIECCIVISERSRPDDPVGLRVTFTIVQRQSVTILTGQIIGDFLAAYCFRGKCSIQTIYPTQDCISGSSFRAGRKSACNDRRHRPDTSKRQSPEWL